MPLPFTRPLNVNVTATQPAPLLRSGAPAMTLPPSNGITMPGGAGIIHTVKDPQHQVPMRNRAGSVVGASVT